MRNFIEEGKGVGKRKGDNGREERERGEREGGKRPKTERRSRHCLSLKETFSPAYRLIL